jgi:hypothetical protein
MRIFIVFIMLILPLAVNAKTYEIGIVASYGNTHAVSEIKSEMLDFVTASMKLW